MKQIFSVILVFSILSLQFSELLIYVSFKLNQDYIAKNLCVEKDVEGSTCKGCCQLKKKVTDQQEQKKDLPPTQTGKQDINLYSQTDGFQLSFSPSGRLLKLKPQKSYKFRVNYSVFRPPK
ncbi:MAG: hypothetical protein ABFS16_00415 [Bacteroidota bacterium]